MPHSRPCGGPFHGAYQTRISEYEGGDAALAAYAELYGRVERKLFADVSAGRWVPEERIPAAVRGVGRNGR